MKCVEQALPNVMGWGAFCSLRPVTVGTSVTYKRKRRRNSISPTFPFLFLWLLLLPCVELHFYNRVLLLVDKGLEGSGGVCLYGAVSVLLRMALRAVILQEEITSLL